MHNDQEVGGRCCVVPSNIILFVVAVSGSSQCKITNSVLVSIGLSELQFVGSGWCWFMAMPKKQGFDYMYCS